METIPIGRRNCIPVIHTKGTHYQVGYDVGRTFGSLIQNYVQESVALKECLQLYEQKDGRELYEQTLRCVRHRFPQYVRELEGTAHGAQVPFYKLFLLHIDQMILTMLTDGSQNNVAYGCSTICCNEPKHDSWLLGHTEDAPADLLGHFYFVSAHVVPAADEVTDGAVGGREERFVSLCYAGHLPGFTMSCNKHGLIYSINVIFAKHLYAKKIPAFFLCRALLSASNLNEVEDVLKDKGCGSAEGFSVNLTFLNESEGDRLFYNFEVGASSSTSEQSVLNKFVVSAGQHSFHCNKYLRLDLAEQGGLIVENSDRRHAVFEQMNRRPKTKAEIVELLSHQSEDNFTVFREYKADDPNVREPIATIAVGIFDLKERTWSIYADKPQKNEPLVVFTLDTLLPELASSSSTFPFAVAAHH